jgi:hypothetical protein
LSIKNYKQLDEKIKDVIVKESKKGVFIDNQIKVGITITWSEFIDAKPMNSSASDTKFVKYQIKNSITGDFEITLYNKAIYQGFSVGSLMLYFAKSIHTFQENDQTPSTKFFQENIDGVSYFTAHWTGGEYTPLQLQQHPNLNPYLATIRVRRDAFYSGGNLSLFGENIGILNYGELDFSKARNIDNLWVNDISQQIERAYLPCSRNDDWNDTKSSSSTTATPTPAQPSIADFINKSKFKPKAKNIEPINQRKQIGDVAMFNNGVLMKIGKKGKNKEIEFDDWDYHIFTNDLDREELLVALDKLEVEKQNMINSRIPSYPDLDDENLIKSYEDLQNKIIEKLK